MKSTIIIIAFVLLSACTVPNQSDNTQPIEETAPTETANPITPESDERSETPTVGENDPADTGTTLNLSGTNLTKVPSDVFEKTELTELNLSNNSLSGALPGEIRFLKNLVVLNLSGNNFTGVPAEVGQLSNLRVLNLSNNSLTGLPYELANLKNLQILNLSGNDYAEQDLKIIMQGLSENVTIIK